MAENVFGELPAGPGSTEMTDERLIYDGHGVPRPNPAFPEPEPKDEPEQFKGEVFEGRVVSYLLGQLSEEQMEQFEDECFAQEYWPSRIKLVEADLIDAYLHDELSPEQRRCFEQNYLTSEGPQEHVRMAAALLRQVCESDAVSEPPSVVPEGGKWAERIKAFWGGRRWQLNAAYAIAALVIIFSGVWLYLARVQSPRVVATLKLTSSVINRSEGAQTRTIKLPPNAEALRVFLMLPNHATPALRYRVELDSEAGETIPLAVAGQDDKSVSVVIPASKLTSGQYALTLFAFKDDGTEQPVYGSYTFTVE